MKPHLLLLLPATLLSCSEAMRSQDAPEAKSAPREEAWGNPDAGEGGRARGGLGGSAEPSPVMAAAPPAAPAGQAVDLEIDGMLKDGDEKEKSAGADSSGGGAARAWFPESFLWMPMVETNTAGVATVPLTVPDTLTTWRVLAVGQSAEGAQGGAVESFLSTLPAYVDVVTPSFLYARDRVSLPVQVVNQGEEPVRADLTVDVGGVLSAGIAQVGVGGSSVRVVPLAAGAPGDLLVRAELGDVDTVERHVTVRPPGRRVETIHGGTLGGPRSLELSGTPGGRFGELRLTVFPGARSVIAQEAAVAAQRGGGVHEAAYAWSLAGRAGPLAGAGDVTAESLRTLSLLSLQQLTYACRTPDADVAAAAYAGLRGAPADTLAGRLADRLADVVRGGQQPDGLYGLPGGASLDAVLVNTAKAVWALGPDEDAARLRAQGAFERHRNRLDNPSVAAWALAAGVVDGELADTLRDRVAKAVLVAPNGSRRLPGSRVVSEVEATALAALVLPDEAVRADLASWLLTQYRPWRGFGGGYTNLVAVEAIAAVMGGEVPASVKIRLEVDGAVVGEGTLDPAAPYDPVTIVGAGLPVGPAHAVRVVADPPVPGLAFTLSDTSYVPWTQAEPAGLDVRVTPGPLRAGVATTIDVVVTGPADMEAELDIGLPAGVTVDKDTLPAEGTWLVEDGALHGTGVRLTDGRWSATLRATPELAGVVQTGPTTVGDGVESFVRVPGVWVVK